MNFFEPDSGAEFGFNRTRRYILWRRWFLHTNSNLLVAWVCLNPSIADAHTDDQSVRKMEGFSRRLGFDGMLVVNLFDLIFTHPEMLRGRKYDELTTKRNDEVIKEACKTANKIICAWGNHGGLHNRDLIVMNEILRQHRRKLYALRINSNGSPAHPLMIPYSERLKHYGKF